MLAGRAEVKNPARKRAKGDTPRGNWGLGKEKKEEEENGKVRHAERACGARKKKKRERERESKKKSIRKMCTHTHTHTYTIKRFNTHVKRRTLCLFLLLLELIEQPERNYCNNLLRV